MAAIGYNAITDGDLEPGKPLTSGLAFRFRDNPLAITQRGANAPWLNGIGAVQTFKPTTAQNIFTWTVPAGVYRAEFIIIGAGTNAGTNQAGGNSSVSGVGTANGGAFNNGIPDDDWITNNGGKEVLQGPFRVNQGFGGKIEIYVANVIPGTTHTITCGIGGGRTLGGSAQPGQGGHGRVIIRY